MTVQQWSTTAADNNSSPPTGAPEGMAAAAVNNTMREMMASVAIEAQVNRVKYLNSVAGTNTITGSMTPALTAYSAGMIVVFTPANANTGAATLNINSLGAISIVKEGGGALVANDLTTTAPAAVVLNSASNAFHLQNPQASVGGIANSDLVRFSQTVETSTVAVDRVGFRGFPQNPQSGNYTTVASDFAKAVVHPSGAGAGDTFTIDGSLYNPGCVIVFINRDSNNLTIAITSGTMTLAGTTSTGSRTLAQNGIATATNTADGWLISGTGLS